MLSSNRGKNRSVCTRDVNLEGPPNRWQLFVTWLFDSLTLAVPVVSTFGVSSLKSPASIWRGVVFVALIVGGVVPSISYADTKPVALYATSAKNIRVVPLVQGSIPNLNEGVDLIASAPCEDDMTQPVNIVSLNSSGDFLTIWWNNNTDKACYSRFTPDGNGSFTEKYMGDWLGGATSVWSAGTNGDIGNIWLPLPAADLNADKIDDLVIIRWHRLGTGSKSVEYKVALGQSDGSFDFNDAATTFITGAWTGSATLADADGDNHADLIYYYFTSGGSHSTDIQSIKGQGDGTFAPVADKKLLVSTGASQGSNLAAIGDFSSDQHPDLFLPPDDDVADEGQGYISFGNENGTFTPISESIDFVPSDEGSTHDTFSASAEAYDVNLDGHLDVVANASQINVSTTKVVYWGDGSGKFSTTGEELFSAPKGTPYPRLTWLSVSTSCVNKEVIFQSGISDDFDSNNGVEPVEPSEGLKKAIIYGSGYPSSWRNFDDTSRDFWFGHTFTNLKANGLEICGATLELKVLSYGSNDGMGLQFTDPNGNRVDERWSSSFSNLGVAYGQKEVISLDLANLPQSNVVYTNNLIPTLNSHGFLDVNVYDDTGVDYVKLNIEYCCNSQEVDVWVADPHPDNGEEPNTVSSNIWASPDVWVRNEDDGGTSYQNVKHGQDNYVYVRAKNRGSATASKTTVEVYRSKPSLATIWPSGWEKVGTTQIDTLAPNNTQIVSIPWDKDTIPNPGHYCFYVRLLNDSDPMHIAEGNNSITNTFNNNNIAWRNFNVVGLLNKVTEKFAVDVINIKPANATIDLVFEEQENLLGNDGTKIFVDLGNLFQRWQDAGAKGENIKVVGGTEVQLLNTPAKFLDIQMSNEEVQEIQMRVDAFKPMQGEGTSREYHFSAQEFINDELVGGVDYIIVARAQDTDTDGDGIKDVDDSDDDNDGMTDEWEIQNGLNPLDYKDANLTGVTINGTKFNDINDDHKLTKNSQGKILEPILPNEMIYIRNETTRKFTYVQTDEKGYFSYSTPDGGRFRIWSRTPSGWTQTTPMEGTGARYYLVNLNEGQSITVDTGIRDLSVDPIEIDINVAPEITLQDDNLTINVGSSMNFNGEFTDTDSDDTHTIEWDFGDGTKVNTLTASHVYNYPGTYQATLTVTDSQEAADSANVTVVVNDAGVPVTPELIQSIKDNGSETVMVELKVADFQSEGILLSSMDTLDAQRAKITQVQREFLSGLSSVNVKNNLKTMPYVIMQVDIAMLNQVRQHPLVNHVVMGIPVEPSLGQSIPLIKANTAHQKGYAGDNQVIAILDTGVDKNHTALADKVINEACFSGSQTGLISVCPNGNNIDLTEDSGLPCTFHSDCAHGTHVAGIAAANGTQVVGVAKDAKLIATQVFSKTNANELAGTTTDIFQALDYVQSLIPDLIAQGYNLAAVNMSLGASESFNTTHCDDNNDPIYKAIKSLYDSGVATVIAAGNDGNMGTEGISYPSCISYAVSVGNTTKSDQVSNTSQTADILDVLAPGSDIQSTIPNDGLGSMSGTSMAAPHVAGTFAVLKAVNPDKTMNEILTTFLQNKGVSITDDRFGTPITKSRITFEPLDELVCGITLPALTPDVESTASGTWTSTPTLNDIVVIHSGHTMIKSSVDAKILYIEEGGILLGDSDIIIYLNEDGSGSLYNCGSILGKRGDDGNGLTIATFNAATPGGSVFIESFTSGDNKAKVVNGKTGKIKAGRGGHNIAHTEEFACTSWTVFDCLSLIHLKDSDPIDPTLAVGVAGEGGNIFISVTDVVNKGVIGSEVTDPSTLPPFQDEISVDYFPYLPFVDAPTDDEYKLSFYTRDPSKIYHIVGEYYSDGGNGGIASNSFYSAQNTCDSEFNGDASYYFTPHQMAGNIDGASKNSIGAEAGYNLGNATGGKGGNLTIVADTLDSSGYIRSGYGGDARVVNCDPAYPSIIYEPVPGTSGEASLLVNYQDITGEIHAGRNGKGISEPQFIKMSGKSFLFGDSKEIIVFAGDDSTLQFTDLSSGAFDAMETITLAVGTGGIIDLRGNDATKIFKAGKKVEIFADTILLDEGTSLESLIDAPSFESHPAKILYAVTLTGTKGVEGKPGETLFVNSKVVNGGPEVDTYTLTITDSEGWQLETLHNTVTVEGLQYTEIGFDVTLPNKPGARNIMTVTATSHADATVKSEIEIMAIVEGTASQEGPYKASGTIRDKERNPIAGVTIQVGDKTALSDATGYWEITGLPEGDNYIVTASKDGYTFLPQDCAVGNNENCKVVFKTIPDLKMKVMASSRTVRQDDNLTYTMTVINGGAETATGIKLTDVLPEGTTLVSMRTIEGSECDAETLTCSLPDLITGNFAKVELVIHNSQTNNLVNIATVTSNEYPTDVVKTRTRVIPHLSVSISDTPDPIAMAAVNGERILHYTITAELSPKAPTAATGIELLTTLPKGVEIQSISSDAAMCEINNPQTVTCQLQDLSVTNPEDISSVNVALDVKLNDAGLLVLTNETKVSALEYPAHTYRERTQVFVPPEYKVKLAFVIDVTGSMEPEMNGVKRAILDVIEELKGQSAFPLSALVVFRDDVSVKAVTSDGTILTNAVEKLKASQGGTCPEASAEALNKAIDHVEDGGSILFVTDASPYKDADIDALIERLLSHNIRVNVLMTGDCTNPDSWNKLPSAE